MTQYQATAKIFAQLLPFILLIAVLYFFIIRPQKQQQKALAKMRSELKPGKKIITRGGLIGKISSIEETTFMIKLHDGTQIEILKDAIISVINEN
ncbi:preprotein translocase subunit YajC [Candidatus Dependentiae bacterium]|nr:preprotein translocase subunit YajC [Candidatus Dependentiae bacterium]